MIAHHPIVTLEKQNRAPLIYGLLETLKTIVSPFDKINSVVAKPRRVSRVRDTLPGERSTRD
jgi:hypothetical protein